MQIQSVLFNKNKYNKATSRLWLIHHKFNANYTDRKQSPRQTLHYYRWRQHDPNKYVESSFRTINSPSPDIKFIIGELK